MYPYAISLPMSRIIYHTSLLAASRAYSCLLPPLLTSSPLPRHALAPRHLAGDFLDLAVSVPGRVAVLGGRAHLGFGVRLVLLARGGPGVGAHYVAY